MASDEESVAQRTALQASQASRVDMERGHAKASPSARMEVLDLPSTLLSLILTEVSQRTGAFHHALVCRRFRDVSSQAQEVVVVKEGASLSQDELLRQLLHFPNLTSIHLHPDSAHKLKMSFSEDVAQTWGEKLRTFTTCRAFSCPFKCTPLHNHCEDPEQTVWSSSENLTVSTNWTAFTGSCPNLVVLSIRGFIYSPPPVLTVSPLLSLKRLQLIAFCWENYSLRPSLDRAAVGCHNIFGGVKVDMSSISLLTSLESLSVSCPYAEVPWCLSALSRLTCLSLSGGEQLTSLAVVSVLTSLEVFMISPVNMFHSELLALPKLQHLVMNFWDTDGLPDEFGGLTALKTLSVVGYLDHWPQSMENLQQLTHFQCDHDCSCDDLSFLPKLTNLEEFGFNERVGTFLSSGWLSKLKKLRVLYLQMGVCESMVCSREVSAWKAEAGGVEEFFLDGPTTEYWFQSVFLAFQNVKILVLANEVEGGENEVCNQLPETLGELIKLEELQLLNFSEVVSLPASMSRLVNLQRLLLDGMVVIALPGGISCPKQLRELHLLRCRELQCLPHGLSLFPRLHSLKVEWCNEHIQLPSFLPTMTGLRELSLKDAPHPWLRQHLPHLLALPCLTQASRRGLREAAEAADEALAAASAAAGGGV